MSEPANEKYELLSREWLDYFEAFLTKAVQPEEIDGFTYAISWEAMNPPARLRPADGRPLGFHIRIRDGKLEFGRQPLYRADCCVMLDYDVMAESYRNTNAQEGRWMLEKAPGYAAEGLIRAYGDPGPTQKIFIRHNVRERVWHAITK